MAIKNIKTLMKVVKFRYSQRFVALSYMWPSDDKSSHLQLTKATLIELETDNSLDDLALPNIVSDAIALCRYLGERYLWIDRLCIIQDDEASKQEQIGAMDVIYNSATFTIMAAFNGRHIDKGLLGCPGRPRPPFVMAPSRRQFHSLRRSILPDTGHSEEVVNGSEWDHRGWTFQERLLSRRRLFITEFEVIFQCSVGTAYEACSHTPNHSRVSYDEIFTMSRRWRDAETNVGLSFKPLHRPAMKHLIKNKIQHLLRGRVPRRRMSNAFTSSETWKWSESGQSQLQHLGLPGFRKEQDPRVAHLDHLEWSHYQYCVREYTKRQLSQPSDVLKAFHGVGNVLGRGLGTKLLYGLPEKYLSLALQWNWQWSHPKGEHALPKVGSEVDLLAESAPGGAPSWSWATARYPVHLANDDVADVKVGLIDFYRYGRDGQSSQERSSSPQKIHARDVLDQHAELTSCDPFHRFFSDVPRALDPLACEVAQQRAATSLLFNTATATCQTVGSNYINRVRLCNPATGKWIGRIRSRDDTWWVARIESGLVASKRDVPVKVVVIGGTRRDTIANKYGERTLLDVLLVDQDPQDPCGRAVRRIGMGFVELSLWEACNPQWETVVLN